MTNVPAELKRKYSGQEVPQWEIDAWNASNAPAPEPKPAPAAPVPKDLKK